MKNIIKNNIKLIVGIFIGLTISVVTVGAATILYNADQVSFTAEDSDFNVTNVQEALNKLYDYHKYIDNISSSQVVIGTFTSTTSVQTITVGFKPSKVVIYLPTTTLGRIMTFYDENFMTNEVITSGYRNDKNISFSELVSFSDGGFSITDTGFTYSAPSTKRVGTAYYHAVK